LSLLLAVLGNGFEFLLKYFARPPACYTQRLGCSYISSLEQKLLGTDWEEMQTSKIEKPLSLIFGQFSTYTPLGAIHHALRREAAWI
jgi:hypothetical protein